MIFINHIPKPPLNQFVKNIVFHSDYNPIHTKEKLLPDGTVNIVIDLTESPKHTYDNVDLSKKNSYKKGWVSGLMKDFLIIESSKNSSMIVIQIRPGQAYNFFEFPLNEITNQIIELEDIWGTGFGELRERILEAAEPSDKITITEKYLTDLFEKQNSTKKIIDYTVAKINSCSSFIEIKKLQNEIGISHKHFIHLFEKNIGVTPKYFLRLMKFQKVLSSINFQKKINWAQLACNSGYYDQSHLINEFKKFTGFSPSNYLNQNIEYQNYIPLS